MTTEMYIARMPLLLCLRPEERARQTQYSVDAELIDSWSDAVSLGERVARK
ncbi:MAG: hypothetical protein JWO42_532 [Chloroflexi bacterium]|nr:hypothetical protein [Chloroflexota bacterium]